MSHSRVEKISYIIHLGFQLKERYNVNEYFVELQNFFSGKNC